MNAKVFNYFFVIDGAECTVAAFISWNRIAIGAAHGITTEDVRAVMESYVGYGMLGRREEVHPQTKYRSIIYSRANYEDHRKGDG